MRTWIYVCTCCENVYDTLADARACCEHAKRRDRPADVNPRERGDDDGVEYADPRDYRDGRE